MDLYLMRHACDHHDCCSSGLRDFEFDVWGWSRLDMEFCMELIIMVERGFPIDTVNVIVEN